MLHEMFGDYMDGQQLSLTSHFPSVLEKCLPFVDKRVIGKEGHYLCM